MKIDLQFGREALRSIFWGPASKSGRRILVLERKNMWDEKSSLEIERDFEEVSKQAWKLCLTDEDWISRTEDLAQRHAEYFSAVCLDWYEEGGKITIVGHARVEVVGATKMEVIDGHFLTVAGHEVCSSSFGRKKSGNRENRYISNLQNANFVRRTSCTQTETIYSNRTLT